MEDKEIKTTSSVQEALEKKDITQDDKIKEEKESKDELKTQEENASQEIDEEIDLDSDDLLGDDFGEEFKIDEKNTEVNVVEGSFTEDFGSYAKGFPDWDLLPPKD